MAWFVRGSSTTTYYAQAFSSIIHEDLLDKSCFLGP